VLRVRTGLQEADAQQRFPTRNFLQLQGGAQSAVIQKEIILSWHPL